jgi:hypothetical protein
MKVRVESRGCPVCGYPDFQALAETGGVTYDICPSCSAESGYEYMLEVEESHLEKLRARWFIEKGGAWWSRNQKPPEGWSASEQLIRAGLSIPAGEENA